MGLQLAVPQSRMAEVAEAADQAGFESLWLPEHLVWPVSFESSYPYSEDGRPPVPEADFPIYDAWVLLAYLASCTRSIRLGTSVYILPLRDPHVTARAVATLDLVSGGRVILGAGVGWMKEEFEIVGQRFEDRGKRTDEIIAVLRELWSTEPAHFDGRHYRFPPLRFKPKPPQGARLPILIGGESRPALERAARLGDGWIGFRRTPESAAPRARELRALRERFDRADVPFQVTVGGPVDLTVDAAVAYRDAGVDRVTVRPWHRGEEPLRGIERAARLIEQLR